MAKSKLGLHGLQIVVLADKSRSNNTNLQDISLKKIGKKMYGGNKWRIYKKKYKIQERE